MLYDANEGTLSYYRNNKFLGTPFDNIDGEVYFCMELCHHGSFKIIQNAEFIELEE